MSKLENKQYVFLELLGKVGIKIPIIQRDYAQGRDEAKDIRVKFIQNLYDVLKDGKIINLDFVYGTVKDNYLIPLDGQQRLTTLFLLHYYLLDDKKELLKKFTYETRMSSREFCSLLIEKEIKKDIKPISQTIKDQTWFFSAWEDDPTISAMLNTLDTIQNIFGDIKIGDEKLKNITFSFLNLDDFQLTDELYIKMNARGKPLSQFEKFKSYFIECIDNTDLKNDKKVVIKAKLDNEWMDIFWNLEKDNLKNTQNEDERKKILKSIDDKYLNFFQNITLFFDSNKKPEEIDIFGFKYSQKNIEDIEVSLNNIALFQGIERQTVEKLRSSNSGYTINLFEDFLKEKLIYKERTRFYALIKFYIDIGEPYKNQQLFISYIRVILNIINNIPDSYDNFRDTLKVIDVVVECLGHTSIAFYEKLCNQTVSNFIKLFELEQKKAKLICQDFKWEEEFIKAETHWYLDGQIEFLVRYATNENNKCIIDSFIKYRDKFDKIFNRKLLFIDKKNNKNYQTLIHRALLTFGDYLPRHKNSSKYTFCSFGNYLQEKNENWRNLFGSEKTIYFQYLLDEIKLIDNIECKLIDIINSYGVKDWKWYFIAPHKDYSIINDAKYFQIIKDKEKIYLNDGGTSVTDWNGRNKVEFKQCYYSYRIANTLKDFKDIEPFAKQRYNKKYCYVFEKWNVANHNFAIDVLFENDGIVLKFSDRKEKSIESTYIIKDFTFIENEKKYIKRLGCISGVKLKKEIRNILDKLKKVS